MLNARRPSYRDINPFQGISFVTLVAMIAMLGFQLVLCYVPIVLGYNTIDIYTNLICMGLGAFSVVWFGLFKILIQLIN